MARSATSSRHSRTAAVKAALRDLNSQLALYSHRLRTQVKLKADDFECLELLNREGPASPTVLAQRTGLHPATLTGVLDRLERGGWIERRRDPDAADRRSVLVHPLKARTGELFVHLAGMNRAMNDLCADYSDRELEVIADFLRRTASAGQEEAGRLGSGEG